jgi:hypothetical protein
LSRVRDTDLDRLDPLLTQLRSLADLRERGRGTFTRGSAPFLHFHSFASGLAADLKVLGQWLRYDVERAAERQILVRDVRRVLRDDTEQLAGHPT